jgi:hypothetical protein
MGDKEKERQKGDKEKERKRVLLVTTFTIFIKDEKYVLDFGCG